MKDYKNKGFGTKAIHAGIEPETGTGAIMTPIYQTSTYAQTNKMTTLTIINSMPIYSFKDIFSLKIR